MASHESVDVSVSAGKSGKPGGGRVECVVVTPERTLFDELVEFVALPLYDGELGVLPGHSPLIGRLGYGELGPTESETHFTTSSTADSRRSATTL